MRIAARTWASVVVAAVLVAVGAVGWWQWSSARADLAGNRAIVDVTATQQVSTEVSRALTQVLSYSSDEPEATRAAAEKVLTGQARTEFDRLFADLHRSAKGQRLTLSATVTAAGVKELTDDTATLLVFVDQSSRRTSDDEATLAAAQVAVTAKKVGAAWTITGLEVL